MLQVLAYLAPATVLCILAVIGIRWPRVGMTLFVLVGVVIAGLMIWDRAYFGLFLTSTLTAVPAIVGRCFFMGGRAQTCCIHFFNRSPAPASH